MSHLKSHSWLILAYHWHQILFLHLLGFRLRRPAGTSNASQGMGHSRPQPRPDIPVASWVKDETDAWIWAMGSQTHKHGPALGGAHNLRGWLLHSWLSEIQRDIFLNIQGISLPRTG